ncbi:hypothetical protein SAMN04489724_4053, partial [Algoriphagus locisalis]
CEHFAQDIMGRYPILKREESAKPVKLGTTKKTDGRPAIHPADNSGNGKEQDFIKRVKVVAFGYTSGIFQF